LVPGATVNALFSLVAPLAALILATSVYAQHRRWIPVLVLAVIALALLVGLLQFTGAQIINPMVNGTPGAVDGMIANRNHFALILAIGLLLTPIWGVAGGGSFRVRAPVALGGVLLLVLTILASGSRAGIVLGVIALALGLFISRPKLKSALRRYPRWMLPAIVIAIVGMIALFVLVSVAADRAVSINRLLGQDAEADLRTRALPTVLAIVHAYLPFGTGLGSFDPIFRLHEPFALLKPTYFNHAHNDFLEIVLTAGLPGLLLLLAATAWWVWRSVGAWRRDGVLPKLGSSMLLLILLASVVDYPARTPLVMAMAMLGAIWLCTPGEESDPFGKAALPSTRRKL
jgi:O-antigen ligase